MYRNTSRSSENIDPEAIVDMTAKARDLAIAPTPLDLEERFREPSAEGRRRSNKRFRNKRSEDDDGEDRISELPF